MSIQQPGIDHLDFQPGCSTKGCGRPGQWILVCHCGRIARGLLACIAHAAAIAGLYGGGGGHEFTCPACGRRANFRTDWTVL